MKSIYAVLAAVVVAGCAAPTTQRVAVSDARTAAEAQKQMDMLAEDIIADRARLQRVHWKLATTSHHLCGRTAGAFGADTMTLPKGDLAPSLARLYGVGEQPTVTFVVAGSPAEAAGIRAGDRILSVDGIPTSDAKAIADRLRQEQIIGRPVPVQVSRAGQTVTVNPVPVKACGYPAMLQMDQVVNAYADGERVMVTRGMMAFTRNDDELALVVAHELAHDSMRHIDAKKANATGGLVADLALAILTRGAYRQSNIANAAAQSYSQEFEAEADYVGLYMLATSGYSIADAPKFWRRMATANPASIKGSHSSSHPSTSYRMVALEEAAKEIEQKRATGVALVPQRKDGKSFVAGEGLMPTDKKPEADASCFLLSNGQCKQ